MAIPAANAGPQRCHAEAALREPNGAQLCWMSRRQDANARAECRSVLTRG